MYMIHALHFVWTSIKLDDFFSGAFGVHQSSRKF